MQTLVDRKMFYYGGVHHATYNSDRCRAPAEHTLVDLPDIDAPFRCAVGIDDQEMDEIDKSIAADKELSMCL